MRSLLGIFIIFTIACQSNEQKIYTTAPDWASSSHSVQNGIVKAVGSGSSFGIAWNKAWNNIIPDEDQYFISNVHFNNNQYSIQVTKEILDSRTSITRPSWQSKSTVTMVVDSISFYREVFTIDTTLSYPSRAFQELMEQFSEEGEDSVYDSEPTIWETVNEPVIEYQNVDRQVLMSILMSKASNISLRTAVETGKTFIHHVQLQIPEKDISRGYNRVRIPLSSDEQLYLRFKDSEAFQELQRNLEQLEMSSESEDDSEN